MDKEELGKLLAARALALALICGERSLEALGEVMIGPSDQQQPISPETLDNALGVAISLIREARKETSSDPPAAERNDPHKLSHAGEFKFLVNGQYRHIAANSEAGRALERFLERAQRRGSAYTEDNE